MNKYRKLELNYKGEAICYHDYKRGLCTKCLSPETPGDSQRSIDAVEQYTDYKLSSNNRFGYRLSHEEAVFQAWQTNARVE